MVWRPGPCQTDAGQGDDAAGQFGNAWYLGEPDQGDDDRAGGNQVEAEGDLGDLEASHSAGPQDEADGRWCEAEEDSGDYRRGAGAGQGAQQGSVPGQDEDGTGP